jgi:hypothetical protein
MPSLADNHIIIGVGTGRCGTKSLAALLTEAGANVSHEGAMTRIDWDNPTQGQVERGIEYLDAQADGSAGGDVSHAWLPALSSILDARPSARVVGLIRQKGECVESWMTHLSRCVCIRNGTESEKQFPTYDLPNTRAGWREAYSQYWEEYNHRMLGLKFTHDQIKLFRMRELNTKPDAIISHLMPCTR